MLIGSFLIFGDYLNILVSNKLEKDTVWASQLSKGYNDLAELHANTGNLDDAIFYNSKSIELNGQFKLIKRNVSSFITKGKISYLQGNDSLAEVNWKKGLEFCELSNNDDLKARLYNNLGSVAYGKKKYDEALQYFKYGYETQTKLNNIPEIVKTANNIGLIYFNQGKYNLSIDYLLKANDLAKADELLDSHVTTLYYLLLNYLRLMDYERTQNAFGAFEEALEKSYDNKRSKQINELEIK